jgi:predicted helicase
MSLTFDDLLIKYRKEAHSERDKGNKFECLMLGFLLTDPQYCSNLKSVWLWQDFFAKSEWGKSDIGIDLVAETHTGE